MISIRTGDAPTEGFGKNLVEVVKSLKNIATETEETANDFLEGQGRRMAKDSRYYRFNVPTLGMIGLEEWKAAPKIATLTEIYLDKGDMADKTAACVQKLLRAISHGRSLNSFTTTSDRASTKIFFDSFPSRSMIPAVPQVLLDSSPKPRLQIAKSKESVKPLVFEDGRVVELEFVQQS